MMAYVRQHIPCGSSPDPVPNEVIDNFWKVFSSRFDNNQFRQFYPSACEIFAQRKSEWNKRRPVRWDAKDDSEVGLAHRAGEYVPNLIRDSSWPVLSSMRNVDADCRISVPWPTNIHAEDTIA
jgi:hypothetical protein